MILVLVNETISKFLINLFWFICIIIYTLYIAHLTGTLVAHVIEVIAARTDETAEIEVIVRGVATGLAVEAEVAVPSLSATGVTETGVARAATRIEVIGRHEVTEEMVNAAVTGPLVMADQSIANDRIVIIIFDEVDDETNKICKGESQTVHTLTEALKCFRFSVLQKLVLLLDGRRRRWVEGTEAVFSDG